MPQYSPPSLSASYNGCVSHVMIFGAVETKALSEADGHAQERPSRSSVHPVREDIAQHEHCLDDFKGCIGEVINQAKALERATSYGLVSIVGVTLAKGSHRRRRRLDLAAASGSIARIEFRRRGQQTVATPIAGSHRTWHSMVARSQIDQIGGCLRNGGDLFRMCPLRRRQDR